MTHLDSCLLIDLYRETRSERPGPAFDVMESLDDGEVLGLSVFVVCELRLAAELSRRPLKEHEALDQLLTGLVVVYPDERFAGVYGRLLASLRKSTKPPAGLDLLIAATALVDDAPLVTRNVRDFSRLPGLRLIRY